MHLLAARADTWGISEPAFLRFYLTAVLMCLAATWLIRRRVLRGRPLDRELHPYEVAYLIGGPRRAIATSVAALHADGALEMTEDGRLRAADVPRTMRAPLDTAVHGTVEQRLVTKARLLGTGDDVRATVETIRDGLIRDGLVVGPRERALSRYTLSLPAALLAVGVARLLACLADGRPVGPLPLVLMAPAMLIVHLLVNEPGTLRSGAAAVKAARAHGAHLDPSMSPAWTTYGPAGVALGVALFGMAALTSVDPAFAAGAELRSHLAFTGGPVSGPTYTGAAGSTSSKTSAGCGGCGGGCGGCGGGCGGCGGCGG